MVDIKTITESNIAFRNEKRIGVVCVFVGATNGIGASTCDAVASLLTEPTIYVVGRSPARFVAQRQRLEGISPGSNISYIEADVSLIAGVDDACKQIMNEASKVDYLCMSSGYLPLNGPVETKEGLEQCFCLSYYSRMRFINNLLPVLQTSSAPRVLSILAGGYEKKMIEDDIGLSKSWTTFNLVGNSTTMTTLAFDYLAAKHGNIIFLHSHPGLVDTWRPDRQPAPEGSSIWWRMALACKKPIGTVMRWFLGVPLDESGQRHAFLLISNRFTPGVWRITKDSELAPTSRQLEGYRHAGWSERIWQFTVDIWDRALNVTEGK